MKVTASWRKDLKCWEYSVHDKEFLSLNGKRLRGKCDPDIRSKKRAIEIGEAKRAEIIAQLKQQPTQSVERRTLPDGRKIPLPTDCFADFVKNFYLPHIQTVKAKSTVKSETWRCRALVEYFGQYRLEEIDNLLCQMFQTYRKTRINQYGVTDGNIAINRIMEVLQSVMQLAITINILSNNPVKGIKWLPELPRTRVLSREEEERLNECLVSPRRKMLVLTIAFVLQAGLRKDEILTLQKRDIDLERKLILLDDSKTGNTAIPLSKELENFTRSMLQWDQLEPEELIFGGVDWIKDTFPEVCKEAKIKGLHFHDLRATYGTRLLENGYDLITVMLAMRHKRVTSTQTYMRLQSHHVRAAIESLSSENKQNLSLIRHGQENADFNHFTKSA